MLTLDNYKPPFERFTQIDWVEATTNTGFTVDNRGGCSFIALGSLDTVGAVVIRPRQSNQSSMRPYVVAAGAPFRGRIDGPFDVVPIYTHSLTVTAPMFLDLLVYAREPESFVAPRAPLYYTAAGVAASGTPFLSANVRGRKRIAVTVYPTSGASASDTFSLLAYIAASTTPNGVANVAVAQSKTDYTGAAARVYEFNAELGMSGSAPGVTAIDFLAWGTTLFAGGGTYTLNLAAWD